MSAPETQPNPEAPKGPSDSLVSAPATLTYPTEVIMAIAAYFKQRPWEEANPYLYALDHKQVPPSGATGPASPAPNRATRRSSSKSRK